MGLNLNFADAVNYVEKHTYLLPEDATDVVKLLYHSKGFKKQIRRNPKIEELAKITEYVKNDKSLAYLKLTFSVAELNKLIQSINTTAPNINKK